jgi:hypothetical protein
VCSSDLVLDLLDQLIHCVIRGEIPHYFLPDNNLFDGKDISRRDRKELAEKLMDLRINPLKALLQYNDDQQFDYVCTKLPLRMYLQPLLTSGAKMSKKELMICLESCLTMRLKLYLLWNERNCSTRGDWHQCILDTCHDLWQCSTVPDRGSYHSFVSHKIEDAISDLAIAGYSVEGCHAWIQSCLEWASLESSSISKETLREQYSIYAHKIGKHENYSQTNDPVGQWKMFSHALNFFLAYQKAIS